MEEERREVKDLMDRFGYVEKEAEAAYHLRQAYQLFNEEIFAHKDIPGAKSPGSRWATMLLNEISYGTHFKALNRILAMRVLHRDYPEGWGHTPAPNEDNATE